MVGEVRLQPNIHHHFDARRLTSWLVRYRPWAISNIKGYTELTEPADHVGNSARTDESRQLKLSNMGKRLATMLNKQIDLLEAAPETSGYSEEQVKSLLTLAKTLQAMETLCTRSQEVENGNIDEHQDILEFRRQLEKKIDALGAGGSDA